MEFPSWREKSSLEVESKIRFTDYNPKTSVFRAEGNDECGDFEVIGSLRDGTVGFYKFYKRFPVPSGSKSADLLGEGYKSFNYYGSYVEDLSGKYFSGLWKEGNAVIPDWGKWQMAL